MPTAGANYGQWHLDAANAPCFQPLGSTPSPFHYANVPFPTQQAQGAGLSSYSSVGIGGDNFLNAFASPQTPAQLIGPQAGYPFQTQPASTATSSLLGWNGLNGFNGLNVVSPAPFNSYQPSYVASPPTVSSQWAQLAQIPPLPQVPQLHQLPQASPAIRNQAPTPNQQFAPSYFQDAIYQKSLEDATKQYDALSAQLSQIDRFTAMHSWVIEPETKKLLVEQRKSLVRELDTVRLYREHLQVLFGKTQMNGTLRSQQEPITIPVTPPQNEAWGTPTKCKSRSLSPTVRNLYRTIEETDERGEPIDGLLCALSGASKGLAKRLNEERQKSLGISIREPSREVSDTFIKARDTKEESLHEAPEKIEYAQPVQVSRRLWQSDPHPHSPLLSQCFNRDWSPILQKSAAPAVSQNVTAHAFLPSFDGAGKIADGFELI